MVPIRCRKGHENPPSNNFCLICGESLVQSHLWGLLPLTKGTKLGHRYVIESELGQGGFGRTYIVKDLGRFEQKLVLKEFIPPHNQVSALEKSRELFQQEAEILCKLNHQQIPHFYEFFEEDSRLFLVEDFIEGKTYEELLEAKLKLGKTGFEEREIKEFLVNILPVVSYLHQQGIIHRDIAPDNIILSRKNGLPCLIDLGAVKQIALNVNHESQRVTKGTIIGKVGYAPDEQIRLGFVAPYSDLYALGVTAIVLLTGKQPSELLDQYSLEWCWQKFVKVSPQLSQILNRMLKAKPEQRFQSAEEILYLLNQDGDNFNRLADQGVISSGTRNSKLVPKTTVLPVNNSGQGGIFDPTVPVPREIQQWNWGAFFLGFFWAMGNQVWLGFFCLIPNLGWFMNIVLAVKGNEWAWKSNRWTSVEEFKKVQRSWATAALSLAGLILLPVLAIVLSVL